MQQLKEYLDKYKITSKEMLEKHIEELNRNTYVDKDLVFMLIMSLDDEELFPNFFSRKKEEELQDLKAKLITNNQAVKKPCKKFMERWLM